MDGRYPFARAISFGLPKGNLYGVIMQLSHLNALRALDAALRHGSFALAAKELGITPAAVGQRVRLLELYLGKNLFVRSGTGIEPTADALSVGDLLKDGFTCLAEAFEQLRPNGAAGHLHITLPESFSENWLSPMLTDFHLQYPDADLYFDPSNRDLDLMQENYDLAIRYGPPGETLLEERVLFGDFVAPVCSPAFAIHNGLRPDVRSLKGVPLIHVTHRTKDPGWLDFPAWGDTFGFDPDHLNHGVRISKTGSGLQAAVAGQGLVLCGIVEAFQALNAGALVLPFGPSLNCRTHYIYKLLWMRSRLGSELRDRFVEWITARSASFVRELDAYLAAQKTERSA